MYDKVLGRYLSRSNKLNVGLDTLDTVVEEDVGLDTHDTVEVSTVHVCGVKAIEALQLLDTRF